MKQSSSLFLVGVAFGLCLAACNKPEAPGVSAVENPKTGKSDPTGEHSQHETAATGSSHSHQSHSPAAHHDEHAKHDDKHAKHSEHRKHTGDTANAGHAKPSADRDHAHSGHGQTKHTAHNNSGRQKAAPKKEAHNGHSSSHDSRAGHSDRSGSQPKVQAIGIGEKVPDFTVVLNGKKYTLSELQADRSITPDGTLVLTFWCSFCHSCRHVELELDKFAKASAGQAGVLAIDASFGETQEEIDAFVKKRGLTLPIALNPDGSVADVFGVRTTTTTVVIDKAGKLRYIGQFKDRRKNYAADALSSVLAGKDVPVKRTRPKG